MAEGAPATAADRLAALLATPIDAVIFDLDGVLANSEVWWHEVRVAYAATRGRTWTLDDSRACMGSSSRTWAATMRERLDLDASAESVQAAIVGALVDRYARERAPAIDGVVPAIIRLAAARPLAVASGGHPAVIAAALAALGIADRFTVVVSADEVPAGKPAPDVYLEAARRLGVAPERALVVEDSLNGVRAGRAAGMRVLLVPNASIPPADGAGELADAVIARLADLDPARLRG